MTNAVNRAVAQRVKELEILVDQFEAQLDEARRELSELRRFLKVEQVNGPSETNVVDNAPALASMTLINATRSILLERENQPVRADELERLLREGGYRSRARHLTNLLSSTLKLRSEDFIVKKCRVDHRFMNVYQLRSEIYDALIAKTEHAGDKHQIP